GSSQRAVPSSEPLWCQGQHAPFVRLKRRFDSCRRHSPRRCCTSSRFRTTCSHGGRTSAYGVSLSEHLPMAVPYEKRCQEPPLQAGTTTDRVGSVSDS